MARLPSYDNFSVAPQGPAATPLRAPSTEGFERSGQQMQQMGQAVQRTAGAVGDIVVDRQNEANRLRVMEAENEAREAALRLAYDPKDGYANVRGGDVLKRESGKPLADEYDEKYGSRIDEIGARLSNDAQRKDFQLRAAQLRASFGAQAMKHEADETFGYQVSVAAGSVAITSEEIASNANDVAFVDASLTRLDTAGMELGRLKGWSGNETTSFLHVARSQALAKAMVSAIESEDPITAQSLFNRYGDKLVEADRIRIEGPLRREMAGRIVMGAADAADRGIRNFETGPAIGDVVTVPPLEGADEGQPSSREFSYVHPLETPGPTVKGGEFGAPRDGGRRSHKGRDYAVPVGTKVRAPGGGVVLQTWNDTKNGGGLSMLVRLDDGSVHGFAHLSRFDIPAGKRVEAGQLIARTGDTGSGGPHLHYTVKVGGEKIDPKNYKPGQRRSVAVAQGTAAAGPKAATFEDYWGIMRSNLPGDASPSLIKEARAEAQFRWALRRESEQEQEKGAMDAAARWIFENPGKTVRQMPASVRLAVPASQWDSLIAFEETVNRPPPRDGSADDRLYNEAISNPESLRGMSDAAFLAKYTGHPSFNSIAAYRIELRNPKPPGKGADPGSLAYPAINAAIDARLPSVEIDPKKDTARAGAIRRHVIKTIASEQQRKGKPLTDAEIEAVVDREFSRTTNWQNTFLGVTTSTERRQRVRMEVGDIAPGTRKEIEDVLRQRGQPLNEENILSVYFAMGQ